MREWKFKLILALQIRPFYIESLLLQIHLQIYYSEYTIYTPAYRNFISKNVFPPFLTWKNPVLLHGDKIFPRNNPTHFSSQLIGRSCISCQAQNRSLRKGMRISILAWASPLEEWILSQNLNCARIEDGKNSCRVELTMSAIHITTEVTAG